MALISEVLRVKGVYLGADFERPGVREAYLLEALEQGLTLGQRLVWQARFCGITRERMGQYWVDSPGERLTVVETADYLGCDEHQVVCLTVRAAGRLIKAGVIGPQFPILNTERRAA